MERCGAATRRSENHLFGARPRAERRWTTIALGGVFVLSAGFFLALSLGGRPVVPAVRAMLGAAGVLLAWRLRR